MIPQETFLGLDVGGTKVHGLLVDRRGEILAEARVPTETQGGDALIAQLLDLKAQLSITAGGAVPVAVGVGLPAAVDPKTKALSAIPNIANMEGGTFYPALCAAMGTPLAVENDVNCAALAEAWGGEQPDPLAFIAIGTGIGMGLVCGGQLLRGAAGAAGEIAYLPLGGDASDPSLRQSGTFESVMGGEGWRQSYRKMKGQSDPDLATLFDGQDPVFAELIKTQAELLAQAILSIYAVVAPQCVVLGGSIGAQPRLLQAVRAALPRYLPVPLALRASTIGAAAGAWGAARAAILLASSSQA